VVSCPKIPPKNQPNIYFLTAWQHWLGIAKPKNAFRSTLSLCIDLLWNFKNFSFNRFFCWLIDHLTIWYLQTSVAPQPLKLWAWFLHCSTSLRPEMCLFTNRCSSNARIMVLPKLTFVLLYFPFSFPLPRRWRFAVAPLRGFMEDLVNAVNAEVFNALSFA